MERPGQLHIYVQLVAQPGMQQPQGHIYLQMTESNRLNNNNDNKDKISSIKSGKQKYRRTFINVYLLIIRNFKYLFLPLITPYPIHFLTEIGLTLIKGLLGTCLLAEQN